MSTETVPVPVELLEELHAERQWVNNNRTLAVMDLLVALIPKPDPHEVAVEVMAGAIASFDDDHEACNACRQRAEECLAALLDLGWTPPEAP